MTFTAVADVSRTLLELFRDEIDRRGNVVSIDRGSVDLVSPEEVSQDSNVRLGLYPYRVTEDGAAGSTTHQIGESTKRDPPLPLALRYLLTAYPVGDDTEQSSEMIAQQRTLGLALQILHDNSRLNPDDCAGGIDQDTSLTLSLTSEPLDEFTSLWSRFGDATYRPSTTLEVRPVMIQSMNEEDFTRVADRETGVSRRPDEPDVLNDDPPDREQPEKW
ncbi:MULTISPECIES: DUF4255 domain-containing protein [Halostella]|uniref:DUF4255 domain-containing protein n=1 Tax=Halostella TaxID=1843185 RepID=UPI001080E5D7|nr:MULTISPECIES: DUF4255 domain-containing protein [Halostella]